MIICIAGHHWETDARPFQPLQYDHIYMMECGHVQFDPNTWNRIWSMVNETVLHGEDITQDEWQDFHTLIMKVLDLS